MGLVVEDMLLDVNTFAGKRKRLSFTVSREHIDLKEENIKLNSDVRVDLEAGPADKGIELRGEIAVEAETACVRCLKPVLRQGPISVELRYVSPDAFESEEESEIEGDDLNTDILVSDQIDMAEVIREQILLDMPTRVLCREDCRGLCDKCGSDLNLIDCKCSDDDVDPRWAALKNIG